MKTELNGKDYVTFARRFVKELVEDMDISGCAFNKSCRDVVPDFAAPGINKSGLKCPINFSKFQYIFL